MQEVRKSPPVRDLQTPRTTATPSNQGGRRSGLRRILVYGVVAALAVAGAIFGVRTVVFYTHHITTDDAQVDGHINPVLPRVAGYVGAVEVGDNQRVAAGDVLLRIDARDFKARVDMAQAALANARAAVTVAQAHVDAAKSKTTKTAQDLTRAATLGAQRVVSQQEQDTAKWAADAAAADYQAATREVTVAESQIVQRQADLDYANLQLSYTTLTAPVAGTVAKKSVEVGQYVQPGQPLMAIVGDREVWVVANFKETQLHDIRIGQSVEVHVDAYPQMTFSGRVDSIAAATGSKFSLLPPDNATGNFVKVVQRVPVKIVFVEPPEATHPLRIGMDVTAIVALQ